MHSMRMQRLPVEPKYFLKFMCVPMLDEFQIKGIIRAVDLVAHNGKAQILGVYSNLVFSPSFWQNTH